MLFTKISNQLFQKIFWNTDININTIILTFFISSVIMTTIRESVCANSDVKSAIVIILVFVYVRLCHIC